MGDLLKLEQKAKEVGGLIGRAIDEWNKREGQNVGFCLVLYDFGGEGFMSYMSNGNRSDTVTMLEELATKMREGRFR